MDWTTKVPPWECQYSALTHTDAEDCVAESLCHIVYMLTGRRYSPRALAYLSNTKPTGNYTDVVMNAANANGLIPYELWPSPQDFTWESYYSAIPKEVLDQGERLGLSLISADFDVSPLWTEIAWNIDTPQFCSHMVAQVNETQYFDSEAGESIKPMDYVGARSVWKASVTVSSAGRLLSALLTRAGVYADHRTSVDGWSWYWGALRGSPVDGGLLTKAFPAMTGSNRLNLTAGEFALAVSG